MLTKDEIRLYDRQIRLWGIETQKRIQQSWVLLCKVTPPTAEVAKNLAASGFNLLISDERALDELPYPLVIPPEADEETDGPSKRTVADILASRLRKVNGFIRTEVLTVDQVTGYLIEREISAMIVPIDDDFDTECVKTWDAIKPQKLGVYLLLSDVNNPSLIFSQGISGRPSLEEVLKSNPNMCNVEESGDDHATTKVQGQSTSPSVAAILGGIISQEVRKHVTGKLEEDKDSVCWNVGRYDRHKSDFLVERVPQKSLSLPNPSKAASSAEFESIDD